MHMVLNGLCFGLGIWVGWSACCVWWLLVCCDDGPEKCVVISFLCVNVCGCRV